MNDRELIKAAQKASENAYVPYSRFRVGAAIESVDGTVYTGCNIENSALGCTICAERTAIFKAVSDGKIKFRCIAIYANSPEYCYPCGSCRQVMSEFSDDLEILCARSDGRYVSYRLYDMLPHSFGADHMK